MIPYEGLRADAMTRGQQQLLLSLLQSYTGWLRPGHDRVWLEQYKTVKPRHIATGPRIGIDYAEDWIDKPWRFWIRNNSYVSRK